MSGSKPKKVLKVLVLSDLRYIKRLHQADLRFEAYLVTMSELDRAAISAMRRSYGDQGLSEADLAPNPLAQFQSWLHEAAQNPIIVEANAMVLGTIEEDGPATRTVLLKDVTDGGFTFFSNYQSQKGRQIALNPKVSLLFPWYAMERQVIVLGAAKEIDRSESEEYFATRPWSSQIGAWASLQSEPLVSRSELEVRFQKYSKEFPEGSSVPIPPYWGGYVVQATSIEFWQGRYSRLHDRIRYTANSFEGQYLGLANNGWKAERFFP